MMPNVRGYIICPRSKENEHIIERVVWMSLFLYQLCYELREHLENGCSYNRPFCSVASTAIKLREESEKEPTRLICFVQWTGHVKKATLVCQG